MSEKVDLGAMEEYAKTHVVPYGFLGMIVELRAARAELPTVEGMIERIVAKLAKQAGHLRLEQYVSGWWSAYLMSELRSVEEPECVGFEDGRTLRAALQALLGKIGEKP